MTLRHLPAVFARRAPHVALEIAVEVLRILETETVCNLTHSLLRAQQFLFRQLYYFGLNKFLRRVSGLFLHEIAEIVG